MKEYVISIPLADEPGEFKDLSFPDTENMFNFLDLLVEHGKDISNIIIPEGSLV